MGTFVMSGAISGGFLFTLHADEGDVVLISEWYTARGSCKNGVDAVRLNAQDRKRYRQRVSDEGCFYFVLTAANGKTVGVSSMFSSEQACELGIFQVMRAALGADVLER